MPEAAVASTTTATKPPAPMVVLRSQLYDRAESFRTALPPHIKPEKFMASVLTAVQITPDLLACERRSLFVACLKCAQDGLIPDGTEAALVPFKGKVSYLPMYQGLLKKFRNSGQFKWVTAGLAYEGETFEHWIDENGEHFRHVPGIERTNKKIMGIYALATTKDGGSFIQVMTPGDVDKRKAVSKASRDDAPWKVWPEEMMKKTALKALSKLLPKSSDIDAFLQRDEAEALGVETTEAIADQRTEAIGDVMDHFAEGGAAPADQAPPEETAPEGHASSADAAAQGSASGGQQPQQPGPAAADDITKAHERGRDARASGMQRKALPPEYRDAAHQREALAWQAGFDGSPLPTFPETKS